MVCGAQTDRRPRGKQPFSGFLFVETNTMLATGAYSFDCDTVDGQKAPFAPIGMDETHENWEKSAKQLARSRLHLGPPVVPFYSFFGEGSPTKIDYRK